MKTTDSRCGPFLAPSRFSVYQPNKAQCSTIPLIKQKSPLYQFHQPRHRPSPSALLFWLHLPTLLDSARRETARPYQVTPAASRRRRCRPARRARPQEAGPLEAARTTSMRCGRLAPPHCTPAAGQPAGGGCRAAACGGVTAQGAASATRQQPSQPGASRILALAADQCPNGQGNRLA